MPSYKAKKKFGQNFLVDHNLINKIINAFAPQESDHILEIGPGLGALTNPLLNRIQHLNVVEIDNELADKLITKYSDRIKLYNIDILKLDIHDIFIHSNKKIRVIGNLPYNISTPILFHLFNSLHLIQDMLFMLQLEVVDRITAKPNTKQYGRLSVMAQIFCDCQKVLNIPATAFNPQPKVESAIIALKPKDNINLIADFNLFDEVVKSAFNQRRKTISNSLKKFLNADDFDRLHLDAKLRAENLTIQQYIELSNYISTKPTL